MGLQAGAAQVKTSAERVLPAEATRSEEFQFVGNQLVFDVG